MADPSRPADRLLLVLRHAKSAWPDVPDHQRPLADRGRADAAAVGRWLRDAGRRPDLVLCSTAARTEQTWRLAAAELGGDPPATRLAEEVYQAGVPDLLELARGCPDQARTVLLVGHNPGMQQLTLTLAGDPPPGSGSRSAAALDRVRAGFRTATLAVLAVSGPWSELAPGAARLVELATPRG